MIKSKIDEKRYRKGNDLCVILEISGELELQDIASLKESIKKHIDQGCTRLEIDLAQVESIPTPVLGALVNVKEWAQGKKCQLVLVNIRKPVNEILDMLGLGFQSQFSFSQPDAVPEWAPPVVSPSSRAEMSPSEQGYADLERQKESPPASHSIPFLTQLRWLFANGLSILGWVLFAFGSSFLWGPLGDMSSITAPYSLFHRPVAETRGIVLMETETIVSVPDVRDIRHVTSYLFEANERRYRGFHLGLSRWNPGEVVEIVYQESVPEYSIIKENPFGSSGHLLAWLPHLLMPMIALVMVACGFWGGVKKIARHRAQPGIVFSGEKKYYPSLLVPILLIALSAYFLNPIFERMRGMRGTSFDPDDPRIFKPFLAAMKQYGYGYPREAKKWLEKMGPRAEYMAAEALKEKEENDRKLALWYLGLLEKHSDSTLLALSNLSACDDHDILKNAIDLLEKNDASHPEKVDFLIRLLKSPKKYANRLGMNQVEKMPVKTIGVLLACLEVFQKGDFGFRGKIRKMFDGLRDNLIDHVPEIMAFIERDGKKCEQTRGMALRLLAHVEPQREVLPLYFKFATKDPSELVRRQSLKSLTETDGWQSFPGCLEMLMAAMNDPYVSLLAIESLGQMKEKGVPAVPALIELLVSGDRWKRNGAFHALVQMGEGALSDLTGALSSENVSLRIEVARVLIAKKHPLPALVPVLVQALQHSVPEVRKKAVLTLGELGTQAAQALPNIQEALNDENPEVRKAAQKTLGKIGSKRSN